MNFELLHTFPDGLEPEWNALLDETTTHVPFLRYEYQRIWWETRGGGEWPDAQLAIVTARQDGRLVGIAPLFRDRDRLMLVGSVEISDYLDLLARPADLPAFLEGLLPFLAAQGWRTLDLYNLMGSSPTLPALEAAAQSQGWRYASDPLQHSPFIPLPADWETYLAGIDKKQRHEIRRKMRRAEESETPVRWYIARDPAAIESEIDAFMALMAQDEDKDRFLTAEMRAAIRQIITCAFEADCLNLAFLEIGGQKAAAYLSFDYLNRLWVYNSGLDRRFMEYSPGWVLLGHLLQWAIQHGFEEFDFMRGNEDYKYRFGAVDRFVYRATLTL